MLEITKHVSKKYMKFTETESNQELRLQTFINVFTFESEFSNLNIILHFHYNCIPSINLLQVTPK